MFIYDYLLRRTRRESGNDMRGESGIEELRRAARMSGYARESAYEGFTAEECLAMIRACWDSGWDILPDALTPEERDYAAKHGKLSARTQKRLQRVLE
jgi:hypothetical protein